MTNEQDEEIKTKLKIAIKNLKWFIETPQMPIQFLANAIKEVYTPSKINELIQKLNDKEE